MFAKGLWGAGVDYDVYKATFPGDLSSFEGERVMSDEEVIENLRMFDEFTRNRMTSRVTGYSSGAAGTAPGVRRRLESLREPPVPAFPRV